MLRAENDHWGVVLLASSSARLPVDDAAYLEFTSGLCDGELRKVLARARPVSPIHNYGPVSNRIMHYERLRGWPEGLVALGDSVCMLDPYFGLGMSAAARGAIPPWAAVGPGRWGGRYAGVPEGTGAPEYRALATSFRLRHGWKTAFPRYKIAPPFVCDGSVATRGRTRTSGRATYSSTGRNPHRACIENANSCVRGRHRWIYCRLSSHAEFPARRTAARV